METASSSETLIFIYQTARNHIPEESNTYIHTYRLEKLNFTNVIIPVQEPERHIYSMI
jgi:hypothetical protein